MLPALALCLAVFIAPTAGPHDPVELVVSASALGEEGRALATLVERFEAAHPDIHVEVRGAPDAADLRHQLYVQWLAAGVATPDVLQLDVVWVAELARAGFLAPLAKDINVEGLFAGVRAAHELDGTLFALPWFVDVGMLYWRTDRMAHAPTTFEALLDEAKRGGFAWQGARYEGLVCTFLEVLGGLGGSVLDAEGRVVVDSRAGIAAAALLAQLAALDARVSGFQEEQARAAFERGDASLMRNWPYAVTLLRNRVPFDVAPLPHAPGGRSTAALGGASLAVNARTLHPREAALLVAFLTSPEAGVVRAQIAGQYPPWRGLYDDDGPLAASLPVKPSQARTLIEAATPRGPTPQWASLSRVLQGHLHAAITGQAEPAAAMRDAAREMRAVLDDDVRAQASRGDAAMADGRIALFVIAPLGLLLLLWRGARADREGRLGLALALPAVVLVVGCALLPVSTALWQAFFDLDLKRPQAAPFVGFDNLVRAMSSPRTLQAFAHTIGFALCGVLLEVLLGLALALALFSLARVRGVVTAVALLPWAVPTAVAAVVFRFLFVDVDAPVGRIFAALGLDAPVWLADPWLAWVPIVLADVWKTTPFVALIVLAGLQGLSPDIFEAARMDGATPRQIFWRITLPLLRPALGVAVLFRAVDALRVFDLVFALTGGGPGTSTETMSLLIFDALLVRLRPGEGAALAMVSLVVTLGLAVAASRALTREELR